MGVSTKFHKGQKVQNFDTIFNLRCLRVAVVTNCSDLSDKK